MDGLITRRRLLARSVAGTLGTVGVVGLTGIACVENAQVVS